jgi:hypothetical protein
VGEGHYEYQAVAQDQLDQGAGASEDVDSCVAAADTGDEVAGSVHAQLDEKGVGSTSANTPIKD